MLSSKNFVTVVMRTPPVGKVGCGWSPRPGNSGNADRSCGQGFSPVSGPSWLQCTVAPAASEPARPAVALCAQLIKDIQHGFLARVREGPARDILGVEQQLFGFRHVGLGGLGQGKFSISRLCYRRCYSMKFSY